MVEMSLRALKLNVNNINPATQMKQHIYIAVDSCCDLYNMMIRANSWFDQLRVSNFIRYEMYNYEIIMMRIRMLHKIKYS